MTWRSCSAKQVKQLIAVAKQCQTADFTKYIPFAIESSKSEQATHVGWVLPDLAAKVGTLCNQSGSGNFQLERTSQTPGAAMGSLTFRCGGDDGDSTFSSRSEQMAVHTSTLKGAGT